MRDDDLELDFSRFEYVETRTLAGEVFYARMRCLHRNTEPVESIVTGQQVATLCLDCHSQLPVMRGF